MTTTAPEASPVDTEQGEPPEHTHPSDKQYLIIGLILAVITAAEVSTYFLDDASTTLLVLTLVPMMIAKFAIVTGYFMHLKYDNPLFKRIFVFGIVLAVSVYGIAMATMEFYDDGFFKFLS
jgi:cytochrome c oxidase subunit 4